MNNSLLLYYIKHYLYIQILYNQVLIYSFAIIFHPHSYDIPARTPQRTGFPGEGSNSMTIPADRVRQLGSNHEGEVPAFESLFTVCDLGGVSSKSFQIACLGFQRGAWGPLPSRMQQLTESCSSRTIAKLCPSNLIRRPATSVSSMRH